MRKKTKIIIVGSISAFVLAFNYWQPSLQVEVESSSEISNADYYFEKVSLKQYDQRGHLASRLNAKKMEHFRKNDSSIFEQPKILFVSQSNSTWQLESNDGELNHGTNELSLNQKASIFQTGTALKNRVKAENLFIDLNQQTAVTEGPVVIETDQSITKADGMKANFKMEQIELKANVETQGTPNESE